MREPKIKVFTGVVHPVTMAPNMPNAIQTLSCLDAYVYCVNIIIILIKCEMFNSICNLTSFKKDTGGASSFLSSFSFSSSPLGTKVLQEINLKILLQFASEKWFILILSSLLWYKRKHCLLWRFRRNVKGEWRLFQFAFVLFYQILKVFNGMILCYEMKCIPKEFCKRLIIVKACISLVYTRFINLGQSSNFISKNRFGYPLLPVSV